MFDRATETLEEHTLDVTNMSMVDLEHGGRMRRDLHNGTQDLNSSRMSAGFADVSQLADEEKEKLDALIERLEEERRRMMGTTDLLTTGQSPRDSSMRAQDEEKKKLRAELENIKHYNSNLEQELNGLRSALNPDPPPRTSTPHDPYRMPQHHHPHFTHPKSPRSHQTSQAKPVQNNILYKREHSPSLHNGSHSPTYSGNILATSGSQVGNHSPFGSNSSLSSSIPNGGHSTLPNGQPPKYHSQSQQPHYERLKGGDSPMLHNQEPPHKYHESYSHSPRSHPYNARNNLSGPNLGHAITHSDLEKNRSPYSSNRSLKYPPKSGESNTQAAPRSSHSTPRSTHSSPRSSHVPPAPLNSSEQSPKIIPPLGMHRSSERPVKPQRSHRSPNLSLADSPTSKPLKRGESYSHREQHSFDSHHSDYPPSHKTSARASRSSLPQRSQSVKSLISQLSSDVTQTPYDVTDNSRHKSHERHSSGTVSSDAESSYYSHEPVARNSHKISPKSHKLRSKERMSSVSASNTLKLRQKDTSNVSSKDKLHTSGRKHLNSHRKSEIKNPDLLQHHTKSTGSNKGSLVHPRRVVSTENLACSRDTLDTLHGGTSDPSLFDSPGRFESSQTGSISPIPDTPRSFDPRREYTEEIDPYTHIHSTDYDITDRSSNNVHEKLEQFDRGQSSPDEVIVQMLSRSDMPLHSSTHTSVETLIKAPYPSKSPKTHPKPTHSRSGSDRTGPRQNIENESPNRQDRPSPKARKFKKKKKELHNTTDNESLTYRTPAEGDIESRFSEKSFLTDESFSSPEEEMKMLVSKMQEIMPSLHDQEGGRGKMSELKTRKPMQEVLLAAEQTRRAIGCFAEYAITVAAGDSQ